MKRFFFLLMIASLAILSACSKHDDVAVDTAPKQVVVDQTIQQHILSVINAKAAMHANFSGRSSVKLDEQIFANSTVAQVFQKITAADAFHDESKKWLSTYTDKNLAFLSVQDTGSYLLVEVMVALQDDQKTQEWFTVDATSKKLVGWKPELPSPSGPISWFLQVFDETFLQQLESDAFSREYYRYYIGERNEYPTGETNPQNTGDVSVEDRGTYNRINAANYAYTWWNGYNPNYRQFEFDCTNFVSQCIKAGGFVNNSDWYYNNYWSWSTKWTVANQFRNWISTYSNWINGYTSVWNVQWFSSSSGLKRGDILCWDFDQNGTTDHVMIVGAIVSRVKNGQQIEDAEVLGHTNAVKKYFKDYTLANVQYTTSFRKIVNTN